ncbi:Tyrosine recombinase XerC [uncultured archaeon]|nr:Tyrosine recombinase XerC [uncultured archaeon]
MINLDEIRKLKEDVYGHEKRYAGLLITLQESSMNEESKMSIKAFLNDYLARGNSKARALKYGYSLKRLALFISEKSIHKLSREEVTDLVLKVQASELKKNTQNDLLLSLKIFYKFVKKTEVYPEEVSWIKIREEANILTKDDLITPEEYKKLFDTASNLKDKVLLVLLHETGCRIGELLTLTLERVIWDEESECYQLNVYGKTKFRVVPVIESVKILKEYLGNHEFKDNLKASLFNVEGHVKSYSYGALTKRLGKVLKRSGIVKRIHPHLFRHTDITEKAGELSDQVMKKLYGWTADSKMLDTYSHLTNKSVTLKMKEFHDKKESKDVRISKALEQIKKMLLTKQKVIEVGFEEIKKNPEEREVFVKLLMEVSKYHKLQKNEKNVEYINKKSGDLLLQHGAGRGI